MEVVEMEAVVEEGVVDVEEEGALYYLFVIYVYIFGLIAIGTYICSDI